MAIVTAQTGDTLCTLAIQAGFLDCAPLRELPANAAFLNRDLKDGDLVTVPEVDPKELEKGTTNVHVFVRKSAPPVSIRFVHGSPNIPYRQDKTVDVLNISNYRTTKGGTDALHAFPADFEFQQPGHVDPDTFKVEVVDPAAGGTVDVLLDAMKPIYAADLTVTGHEPFDVEERQIKALKCKKVRSGVAYRSKYLRLVTDSLAADPDAADKQSKPEQTLLIADLADGTGTGQPNDEDTMEILDQQVRASYTIQRCPGGRKCTVRTQAPIGGDERRKISVAIHMYRTAVGGSLPAGITEQSVRFRLFKWFRRLYAQANLGPKLVGPVTTEDPPPADTIVISDNTGAPASGAGIAAATSTFSCTIEAAPGVAAGTVPSTNVVLDLSTVAAPRTPSDVADALISALPAGFSGQKFVNPLAFNATNGSAEVTISHSSGARIVIRNETHDDSGPNFTMQVVRVSIANLFVDAPENSLALNTAEQRRIMRQVPGSDDVLHFYVVGRLVNASNTSIARGIAVLRLTDLGPAFVPSAPIRNKAFMAAVAMDLSDTNPFSFPHEAGHVLGDVFHVATNDPVLTAQMMRSGTSGANAETASKRISDNPVLVRYEMLNPAQPTAGASTTDRIIAVDRFRTRGAGLLQPW